MRIGKLLFVIGFAGLVSACGAYTSFTEVNNINAVDPVGSPFTVRLTEEYRIFSNFQLRQDLDYPDAIHFARKGLVSAEGELVMPEPVNDWDLTTGQIEALSSARARLMNVFDLGARERFPDLSAVAQSRFDCWCETAEEDSSGDATGAGLPCQAQFFDALTQLEAALVQQTPEVEAVVAVPTEPVFPEPVEAVEGGDEPVALTDAIYLVFFDFDKSNLTPTALDVIDSVATEVENLNVSNVTITGHTDSSGSKSYNEALSRRRAAAVMKALVQRGVPANMITTVNKGESELLVPTPDNVKEAANRRATITFE